MEYSLDDTGNEMIHLTNDAVQKKGDDFGKHEDSNKVNDVLRSLASTISDSTSKKQVWAHSSLMSPTSRWS